ncbi:DUF4411 family protein [Histidinibacterium aquaticum]|uniref:DUF4411 family protein n=1 Tax=Histidinibacterium aquaticum TaxID=2613962 RepID=A0A5J5GRJ4_9RHOB|nr:DUF4411 family protein [Histidinibacterium aquaticum]KAA9010154.1 DUF4411 family protein [Histidinibacterium aquaticum]
MPKYCLDTSWISNPLLEMPPDIHVSLWEKIGHLIDVGSFCWNVEIWEELDGSIGGQVGQQLGNAKQECCLEVGVGSWAWRRYLKIFEGYRTKYKDYISEYNGNRKGTVGLNDCSIVALGATLRLPVASMERRNTTPSQKKIRIPELCDRENVEHFDFNRLLRAENIKA